MPPQHGSFGQPPFRAVSLIGSIVAVRAGATADDLVQVLRVAADYPWLPIVLEQPDHDRAESKLARVLLPQALRVMPGVAGQFDSAAKAIIEHEVAPSEIQLYLRQRCITADHADLLFSCVHEKPWLRLGSCRSSYYEALRGVTSVGRKAWRSILAVTPFAGKGHTTETIAFTLELIS